MQSSEDDFCTTEAIPVRQFVSPSGEGQGNSDADNFGNRVEPRPPSNRFSSEYLIFQRSGVEAANLVKARPSVENVLAGLQPTCATRPKPGHRAADRLVIRFVTARLKAATRPFADRTSKDATSRSAKTEIT